MTDESIRVLMFVPQYPFPIVGGLEKQSHELAKALIASGSSVRVLSGKVKTEQPEQETVEGVPVQRLAWSRHPAVRAIAMPLAIGAAMWRSRRSVDVVHVHQHSWISVYVIMLAKLLGKGTLAKLANVGELGLPGMGHSLLGRFRRSILLTSDAVVAMSGQSLRELEACGYPLDRVLITPNGIAMAGVAAAPGPDNPDPVCRVVFAGRLTAQKQLHVLLDAWEMVSRNLPGRAVLELWGEGELAGDLKAQARRLGIADDVLFAGHVSNVASRLRQTDIFVLPSLYEGNSNAILEAMAAGLPIVSTPVGGTAMQLGAEGRSWLVPPGDVLALSERLTALIRDPVMRKELGEAMRRRATQHFEIGVIARSYSAAYLRLAAGRREKIHECSNPVVTENG